MKEVTIQYFVLAYCWILYCVVHSFLADERVKGHIQTLMKGSYKYYRPLYAIFATLTLIALLWFHFSINSNELFVPNLFIKVIGYLITFLGAVIMIICIKKYFYELSGLKALKEKEEVPNTLQTSGLHSFVRHPLYFGTLAFIWGLVLIMPLYNNLIGTIVITIYVWLGIYIEEKKLLTEYGDAYAIYKQKVPRLLPFSGTLHKNKSRY